MFHKQFQMFRLAKERVIKAIATRFWGKYTNKTTKLNIHFSEIFPGKFPKGSQCDKSDDWWKHYRQKRKELNRTAFESRRKNWGK